MNTNLLNIINRIVAEQGEGILADAKRLFPFFADYAKNEYKEERVAFGRCIEYGAYQELKKTGSADERQRLKATLADQINAKTGVDRKRCADALDLLEVVIFKTVQQSTPAPSRAKFCTKCGKELQAGWTSCPYCSTPAAKAGMQTSRQESPRPETPVYSNNTFSQTQQPVNLTTSCQGCLLNHKGDKCTYFNWAILVAERYDCGMRGLPELQKKLKNGDTIRFIVILLISAIIGFFNIDNKLFSLLGINFFNNHWLDGLIITLVLIGIYSLIYQGFYKKRRENAKRF